MHGRHTRLGSAVAIVVAALLYAPASASAGLAWSTLLGGDGYDDATAVAIGPDGSVFVAGGTSSPDFPAGPGWDTSCGTDPFAICNGAPLALDDHEERADAFVAKFAPGGARLEWATYLGGGDRDSATAIAVDAAGRPIVAGITSSTDFPVTAGAAQTQSGLRPHQGWDERYDGWAARLSADGGRLEWATYVAGTHADAVRAVAIDGAGRAVLAGSTASTDFPRTAGALGEAAHTPQLASDVWVARLGTAGERFEWSGVFGGLSGDGASDLELDAGGGAVVAGTTTSSDFFTTAGAFRRSCEPPQGMRDCWSDGFAARVAPGGGELTWSTYVGSSDGDGFSAVALDGAGDVLLAGSTYSPDFPGAPPGGTDGPVVAKLARDGTRVEWARTAPLGTFADVAVSPQGGVVVAGWTGSRAFPVLHPLQSSPGATGCFDFDCHDAVAARFSADGVLEWSTYLGGSGEDEGRALALDGESVVLTGYTESPDFPTSRASDAELGDSSCDGREGCPYDAFLTRLAPGSGTVHDAFAEARRLRGPDGTVSADATAATTEPGEPDHGGPGRSVWLRWTAPAGGRVTFTAAADAVLAVYRGGTLTGLERVAGGAGAAAFDAVAGREYRIAVDGTSRVGVAWSGAPPQHDRFADPKPIAGDSGTVSATTAWATVESGEPWYHERSVWLTWTAPRTGTYEFRVDAPESVRVFEGDSPAALRFVGSPAVPAQAGRTYRIAVGSDGAGGEFRLAWRYRPPPPNDAFAAAQAISGAEGRVGGDTIGATSQPGVPHGESIWYRWTAPADGRYGFRLDGPDDSDQLWVDAGSAGALRTLDYVQSDDEGYEAVAGVHAGQVLYLAVAGSDEGFEVGWRPLRAEPHDLFSDAADLGSAAQGRVLASGEHSSAEPGEPSAWRSTWYSWTAPASGPVMFALDNTPHEIVVYTGDRVDALTEVATVVDWDEWERVDFDAVAGTTYRLWIPADVWEPEYVLRWDVGPPPNQSEATATVLPGASGSVTADSFHTTEDPSHPPQRSGPVYFRWTAPASGPATIAVEKTWFHGLTVYGGGLHRQSHDGRVSFTASAGTAYTAVVSSGPEARFELRWNQAPGETDPPEVVWRWPVEGAVVARSVRLEAWRGDASRLTRLEFLLDGEVVWSSTTDLDSFRTSVSTQQHPNGPATLTARAWDEWGNAGSASRHVVIDNAPPQTTIAGGRTGPRAAAFSLGADDPHATYRCRLDTGWWIACAAEVRITGLADGGHVFRAAAVDAAGNADPHPARVAWVEDGLTGPEPTPTPTPTPTATPEPSTEPEPSPRPTPTPTSSSSRPAGPVTVVEAGRLAVTVGRASRRALLRRGLPVRVSCPAACSLRARLTTTRGRLVATTRGSLTSPGEQTLRLKATRSRRAWLTRLQRPIRVVLVVTADGDTRVVRRFRLRRR